MLSIGVLMIIDNAIDGLFAIMCLILGLEQFDTNTLSQGVEVLVQKQFLHLLIKLRQFLTQDTLHNDLMLSCGQMRLVIFYNMD